MRKRRLPPFLLSIAPFVFLLVLRLIGLTCKVRLKGEWKLPSKPVVFVLWHGELVPMPLLYQYFFPKERSLAIIVSQHRDGELLAGVVRRYKIQCLRGSSRKGAVSVLRQAFRAMDEGHDVAITPDGPKGPRHSVADGALALSTRKHAPIVTINCTASRFWQFKSWDRMFLPKPFSTITFYVGDPFSVKGLPREEAKALMHERLMQHAF